MLHTGCRTLQLWVSAHCVSCHCARASPCMPGPRMRALGTPERRGTAWACRAAAGGAQHSGGAGGVRGGGGGGRAVAVRRRCAAVPAKAGRVCARHARARDGRAAGRAPLGHRAVGIPAPSFTPQGGCRRCLVAAVLSHAAAAAAMGTARAIASAFALRLVSECA